MQETSKLKVQKMRKLPLRRTMFQHHLNVASKDHEKARRKVQNNNYCVIMISKHYCFDKKNKKNAFLVFQIKCNSAIFQFIFNL